MTSFLTVLFIVVLIGACYLLAKYNRNDNLFLILVMALLAGMAGGAIYYKFNNGTKDVEKKSNLEQVYPTQVLPVDANDLVAVLGVTSANEPELASKDYYTLVRDIKIDCPSKSLEEIPGLTFNPRNKGTPGMPFDTS